MAVPFCQPEPRERWRSRGVYSCNENALAYTRDVQFCMDVLAEFLVFKQKHMARSSFRVALLKVMKQYVFTPAYGSLYLPLAGAVQAKGRNPHKQTIRVPHLMAGCCIHGFLSLEQEGWCVSQIAD